MGVISSMRLSISACVMVSKPRVEAREGALEGVVVVVAVSVGCVVEEEAREMEGWGGGGEGWGKEGVSVGEGEV